MYTVRIQKGGASIDDMRALIRVWNSETLEPEFIEQLITDNVLSKKSRARTKDVINRIFIPRFVRSEPENVWRYLQILEQTGCDTSTIVALLYFHTAMNDELLRDLVIQEIYDRFALGMLDISVEDAIAFIQGAETSPKLPEPWSPIAKCKVARGLLAALRDFGVLSGKTLKAIKQPYITPEAFSMVAYLLHLQVASGSKLLSHEHWKLYMLSQTGVERNFLEAHQRGYLSYQAAGKIVRIEFPFNSIEEMAHALSR